MCQHAEGESDYLVWAERSAAESGFAAQQRGEPRESNPYKPGDLGDRNRGWFNGWDTAARGGKLWWVRD